MTFAIALIGVESARSDPSIGSSNRSFSNYSINVRLGPRSVRRRRRVPFMRRLIPRMDGDSSWNHPGPQRDDSLRWVMSRSFRRVRSSTHRQPKGQFASGALRDRTARNSAQGSLVSYLLHRTRLVTQTLSAAQIRLRVLGREGRTRGRHRHRYRSPACSRGTRRHGSSR